METILETESHTKDATIINNYEYDLSDYPPEGFGFIYLITNIINGKQYVGKTKTNIITRWNRHCSKNGCIRLSRAIQKHGKENFKEEILGIFLEELLDLAEMTAIKEYNTRSPNGYNLTDGGDGGKNPTPEARAKMSKAHKGKKQSKEWVHKRMIGAKGRKYTQEQNARNSERQKNSLKASENMKRLRLLNLGRKASEETKQKMSIARKGIHAGEKHPLHGKHHSEETKQKMSLAHKGNTCRKDYLNRLKDNPAGQE